MQKKNQPKTQKTQYFHLFQNKCISGLVVLAHSLSGSAFPLTFVKMALLEKHHFVCLKAGKRNFPNRTMGEVQTSQILPFFRAAGSTRGSSLLALCPKNSFACGKTGMSKLAWANWLSWRQLLGAAGGGSGISTVPGRWSSVLEDFTHDMVSLTRQGSTVLCRSMFLSLRHLVTGTSVCPEHHNHDTDLTVQPRALTREISHCKKCWQKTALTDKLCKDLLRQLKTFPVPLLLLSGAASWNACLLRVFPVRCLSRGAGLQGQQLGWGTEGGQFLHPPWLFIK